MGKQVKIISIDGTRGSGKTSQIGMLARLFRSSGTPVLVISAGKDVATGLVSADKTRAFLNENHNGLVFLEGSIARPMVSDLMIGMSRDGVIDKYKHLTHAYERLDHDYGLASFLMIMDDLSEGERRIKKNAALLGHGVDAYDMAEESDIVNGMRFFNNHVASKNIQFRVVEIDNDNTMMEINKSIISALKNDYELPAIKKDESDW